MLVAAGFRFRDDGQGYCSQQSASTAHFDQGVRERGDAELFVDVAKMIFHGVHCDAQGHGNFNLMLAARGQANHFPFALGKTLRFCGRRGHLL